MQKSHRSVRFAAGNAAQIISSIEVSDQEVSFPFPVKSIGLSESKIRIKMHPGKRHLDPSYLYYNYRPKALR